MRYALFGLGLIFGVACVAGWDLVRYLLARPEPVRQGHSVEWLVADDVAVTAAPAACPEGMVEVKGYYCPFVDQPCLEGSAAGRCKVFGPSVCRGLRVPLHYCIDRYEYPNVAGQRPTSWMSWTSCKTTAAAVGKRLCSQEEWAFSCESEGLQAYPYFPGQIRRDDVCNTDQKPPNVFLAKHDGDTMSKQLDRLLVPSGSMPSCVSPWGVYDQVGNLDEFVVTPNGGVGLMGGHIFGVRNRCRAVTTAHGPTFAWYETTCRFCQDL